MRIDWSIRIQQTANQQVFACLFDKDVMASTDI